MNENVDSSNKKRKQLEPFIHETEGKKMTSNEGIPISDDENSLTAGDRGPTLIEDFLAREKLAHFDRERIPERVVHARGYGAHGEFQLYESLSDITMADFLQDPNKKHPFLYVFHKWLAQEAVMKQIVMSGAFLLSFIRMKEILI